MRATTPTRSGLRHAVAGVLVTALVAAMLVSATSAPAAAEHQNCGKGYPDQSLSNGHPDLDSGGEATWAGQGVINDLESAIFAVSTVKEKLMDAAGITNGSADILTAQRTTTYVMPEGIEVAVATAVTTAETVLRLVAFGLTLGATGALIAETALQATLRKVGGSIGGANSCNDVLMGDMLDQIWVAMVQRNLASDGPPLAMLLIPTDSEESGGNSGEWPLAPQHEKGDFDWCPEIDLPTELPTPADSTNLDQPDGEDVGGDCTPGVHDGFLDIPYKGAPRVTVEAIVRDSIDHAKAHGLPIRDAESHFTDAKADLAGERYKQAYAHFRLAYQAATGFDG